MSIWSIHLQSTPLFEQLIIAISTPQTLISLHKLPSFCKPPAQSTFSFSLASDRCFYLRTDHCQGRLFFFNYGLNCMKTERAFRLRTQIYTTAVDRVSTRRKTIRHLMENRIRQDEFFGVFEVSSWRRSLRNFNTGNYKRNYVKLSTVALMLTIKFVWPWLIIKKIMLLDYRILELHNDYIKYIEFVQNFLL